MVWFLVAFLLTAACIFVVMMNRRVPASRLAAVKPPTIGPKGGAGDSGAATGTTAPRAQLSPALRAELEQTPQWWFDRFHQLLRASGAQRVGGEEWELDTFSGPVYLHREEGFVDCPCRNCRRICR